MKSDTMRTIGFWAVLTAQLPIGFLSANPASVIERELWLLGAFNVFCLGLHAGRWWSR